MKLGLRREFLVEQEFGVVRVTEQHFREWRGEPWFVVRMGAPFPEQTRRGSAVIYRSTMSKSALLSIFTL